MKNILFVSDYFLNGGLETHLLTYAQELNKKGYAIFLATQSDKQTYVSYEGFKKVYHLVNTNDKSAKEFVEQVNEISKIVEEEQIDFIHAHPFITLISSFFVSQKYKIPFSITLHGPLSIENELDKFYALMLKVIIINSSKVFVVSEELKRMLLPYHAKDNVIVLPNPVSTNKFLKTKVNTDVYAKWALVSRLDDDKFEGITNFIELAVFVGVKEVVIFGNGQCEQKIKNYIENLEEKILINIKEFSSSLEFDLQDDFSMVAGMGRVILEASSMNLPIILVGYDGVKGLCTRELLEKASWYNFSGRGLKNIGSGELIKQLAQYEQDSQKFRLREYVLQSYAISVMTTQYIAELNNTDFNQRFLTEDILSLFDCESALDVPYTRNSELIKSLVNLFNSKDYLSIDMAFSFQALKLDSMNEKNDSLNDEIVKLTYTIKEQQKTIHVLENIVNSKERLILNQHDTLNEVYTSKLWRYGSKLYTIKDKYIIRYLYGLLKSLKHDGVVNTCKMVKNKIDDKLVNKKLIKYTKTSNYGFSKTIEDKNAKKVSVILPVYNQADMIDESIASVLSQTYKDFELIIINDGSTDGIEDVLAKYEDDARILILNQQNQKLPIALNNGFHFATGNYFTWTSADNIMMPRHLEVLVDYLEENPTKGMVYSNYEVIDDAGNPLNDSTFRPQNQDENDLNIMRLPGEVTFENLHDSGDNYIGASFMYRKNVAMSVGKYTNDTFGGEDYDYWLRIHNLYPIGFVKDVLYKYRVHENTLNSKAKELNLFENIQRLLKRDKNRRLFLTKEPEFIQVGVSFQLPNKNSEDKVYLFHCTELTNIDFTNNSHLMVLLIDDMQDIDLNILIKFDMIVCADEYIYNHLDVKENFKYKLLYLNLNNLDERNLFVKVATNRLFDKQNIIEKVEVLPQYVLNKKIYIAFVIESLDKGGLEKVVYNLVVKLNPDKFKVTVLIVGNEQGLLGGKLQKSGFDVKVMHHDTKEFNKVLKEESFDLLNYHYTLFGIDACKHYKIPTLYTVHNTYVWLSKDEYRQRYEAYKKIDRFMCVSDNVMKYFINKFEINNPYIEVIPNGFNLSDFYASGNLTREELKLSKNDFVFVNLASINGSKMQKLIVNVMKELKREYANFKVLFVGNILDEKYYEEVMYKIKQYDLEDNIIFLDYVSTENVGSLLKLSDCFLLPSLYEGWSNAIMEAMYCELPLIVTKVGSSDNLINNSDIGIVIDNAIDDLVELNSKDIFKLAYSDTFTNQAVLQAAMIDMYEYHDSWKEKAKLGKNKILDFYTLDVIAEKYEDLFQNSYFHGKVQS